MTKKTIKILNLGCGDSPIQDAINIDSHKTKHVDQVVDLIQYPWKWKSNSIDGIYTLHTLEHIKEPIPFLKECHRILRPGGFLYIQVPHSSNVTAIGDLTHYRTFSLPTLPDLLTQPNWMFKKQLFQTQTAKIVWWDSRHHHPHPYINFIHNQHLPNVNYTPKRIFMMTLSAIIQPLINLSPPFFERMWCNYVGGADEIIWKGVKV